MRENSFGKFVLDSWENYDFEFYYEKDCNPALLDGKNIAIIGYGNQAHAHALNLKDSGHGNIKVALREGSGSVRQASNDGFEVVGLKEAAQWADICAVLIIHLFKLQS